MNSAGQSLNILINDSENYHASLEENRKLYNEIQELKGDSANKEQLIWICIFLILWFFSSFYYSWPGNIRVYCRIRPFLPGEDQKSTIIEYVGDNGDLVIANPTRQGKEGSKSFKFNKVLGPTASQGTNECDLCNIHVLLLLITSFHLVRIVFLEC